MKMILDKRLVAGLTFEAVPVVEGGKMTGTVPNTKNRHFVVFDAHHDAPTGFGLRVSQSVKTYILQIRQGAKVVTVTVGRHPDLLIGKEAATERNARLIASELSARLRRGENVNATRRQVQHDAQRGVETLRTLFDDFLAHYENNAKREPRANTVMAIKSAMKRLGDKLLNKPADAVTWMDIEAFFNEKAGVAKHLTAAEQTVRWVSAVYNRANDRRDLLALQAGADPVPLRNPATIFAKTGKMRDNAELQRDYERKGIRKPLSAFADNFRQWLDYVLDARNRDSARTGADYLLVTMLMGCRRTETAGLYWSDRVPEKAAQSANVIDLDARLLVLRTTKNRHIHRLPLPSFVLRLLMERRELVGRSPFVFPSVSRSKLSRASHYTDPRSFMDSVKQGTQISFAMHDLRRTFGNVVNNMAIPSLLTQQLLNHRTKGSTAAYTQQSLEQLAVYMERIETEMLSYATVNPKAT